MFFRYLTLSLFIINLIFQQGATVFASSEVVFDNPTFGDISATASQSGGVDNSYPIAGDNDISSKQYCLEKGMYFAYYTVGEPSPFGTKAAFNSGISLWETTAPTTKLVTQIICSTLPIIGTSNAGGLWANNYWDTNFPGTGSGSIGDVKIKARVLPSLNMAISEEEIDLGGLAVGVASTGSLFLEVGTNAKAGVSITARSGSGGLENLTEAGIMINQDTTDGITGESYTFASTIAAVDDAASAAFVASGLTELEVDNNVTEHTIYSTNKSESTNLINDVEFIVSATAGAETPAGEYEDSVTFTISGNF